MASHQGFWGETEALRDHGIATRKAHLKSRRQCSTEIRS